MQDTLAIIFDFDDTLAPDSTSGYLAKHGVDVPKFWEEVQGLLNNGWDPVPAYLHHMLEYSTLGKMPPLEKAKLSEWGKSLPLHPGAENVFRALRGHVLDVYPRANVEFFLISSGIGEVLKQTPIAKEFTDIWASDFAYDEKGIAVFPKNIVSFTDKTRYLFHIQKGLIGQAYKNKPFDVNKKIDDTHLHIPMNQMIFVGDGYTDIPCFSMIRKNGGTAIAVYDRAHRNKWGKAWGFVEDGRVSSLRPADYTENSPLVDILMMAAESQARKIALKHQTYQG